VKQGCIFFRIPPPPINFEDVGIKMRNGKSIGSFFQTFGKFFTNILGER